NLGVHIHPIQSELRCREKSALIHVSRYRSEIQSADCCGFREHAKISQERAVIGPKAVQVSASEAASAFFITEVSGCNGDEESRQYSSRQGTRGNFAEESLSSVDAKGEQTSQTDERHVQIQIESVVDQEHIWQQRYIRERHEEERCSILGDGEHNR